MVSIPPPKYRKRRRAKAKTTVPTPPGEPLTLASATYEVGGSLVLTFDRAIDVSGIVPAAFVVEDGPNGFTYQGISVFDHAGAMVGVELSGTGEYEGPTVLLNVPDANGIAADDDGGTWAGVTDLELPYP